MASLRIKNIYHKYGVIEVLNNISLVVKTGQTLAIVGPSGCGKSTLLHIMAGLIEPSEGFIKSSFTKQAVMFQSPRLLPWKNAMDNLAIGLKAQKTNKKQLHKDTINTANQLGLSTQDLEKYPDELSGGMQSRIALGRALIIQPDLLLLDEPFSSLDIGLKLELYSLLRKNIESLNTAVVMITHDIMEAVRLADTILMMAPYPGRIIADYDIDTKHDYRNNDWVYTHSAQLLRQPEVISGFGLPIPQGCENA